VRRSTKGRGSPGLYLAHFDAPRDKSLLADLSRTRLQVGHFRTDPALLGVRRARQPWTGFRRRRSLRGRRRKPRARRCPDSASGSCAAGLRVPSQTTRRPGRTFPESGLPDCWSGRQAGLHNGCYQEVVSKDPGARPLLITPIMYRSYLLEPALPATFPESGLPWTLTFYPAEWRARTYQTTER